MLFRSEEEGKLEYTALVAMHRNLAEAKMVDADAEVTIGMGLGKGTGQFSTLLSNGTLHVIGYPHGMNQPEKLGGMPHAVMKEFSKLNLYEPDRPIIALKSGCLLALDREKKFREKFVEVLNRPQD